MVGRTPHAAVGMPMFVDAIRGTPSSLGDWLGQSGNLLSFRQMRGLCRLESPQASIELGFEVGL